MRRLFRQFSTPGGIPSHVSVPTPGSIHEGGELGYVLTHAFGAAFDNPDLVVAAVVGDGEAETGPLEGSWKSTSFLDPARDGAVLPILHLNGYKIGGPTVLGAAEPTRRPSASRGSRLRRCIRRRRRAGDVHQQLAAALDACFDRIAEIQRAARADGVPLDDRPRWPAIVLRTPKGWTGPEVVDGEPVEGTFRSHQVPLPSARTKPDAARDARAMDAQLSTRIRCSTATDAWCRNSRRLRRRANDAWARIRTRTADVIRAHR